MTFSMLFVCFFLLSFDIFILAIFGFLNFLNIFLDLFFNFLYFLKLLRLLLKVTKVTTEHQKWPKMGQNSIMSFFLAKGKKKSVGQRPNPSAGAKTRPT